jgi:hypothetical protein
MSKARSVLAMAYGVARARGERLLLGALMWAAAFLLDRRLRSLRR